MRVIGITGIGSEIIKSIDERSKLSAQAYNTIQDFTYLKNCPKVAFYKARIDVMNGVAEYKRLRACFYNYQDDKTLKRDRQIQEIVNSLNRQELTA